MCKMESVSLRTADHRTTIDSMVYLSISALHRIVGWTRSKGTTVPISSGVNVVYLEHRGSRTVVRSEHPTILHRPQISCEA